MMADRVAVISVVPSELTARAAMEPWVRVSWAGLRMRTRFLAYLARCRRAIRRSVLPENMGPTITSRRAVMPVPFSAVQGRRVGREAQRAGHGRPQVAHDLSWPGLPGPFRAMGTGACCPTFDPFDKLRVRA